MTRYAHTLNTLSTRPTPSEHRFDALSPDTLGLVQRHTEWSFITKAIIQSQSKLLLLLGDAGCGKSALIHQTLDAMANSPTHGLLDVAPHQAISLHLSQIPRSQWHHWRIEDLLFEGMVQWAEHLLGHILTQANTAFDEHQMHLSRAEFLMGVQDAHPENFWRSRLKQMIQDQQGMLDKWFTRQDAFIHEHAARLAHPWGRVAAKVLASRDIMGDAPVKADQLVQVLHGIGQTLRDDITTADSSASFTLFIDEWDALLLLSPQQMAENRQALAQILRGINDKKLLPLHVVVSTRPDQLMQQLGGGLYALLRQKTLFSPLNLEGVGALVDQAETSTPFCEWLHNASMGLPQQALGLYAVAQHKAETFDLALDGPDLLEELSLTRIQDVWQGRFARLQLDALEHGTPFLTAIQVLLQTLPQHPFYVDTLMAEILEKEAERVTENDLGLALRQLFVHQFLEQVETPQWLQDASNDRDKPSYQFENRSAFQALYDFMMPNTLAHLHQQLPDPSEATDLSTSLDMAISTELVSFQNGQHAEHLVALLPKTLQEGGLTPQKVRSVVDFIRTLSPDQQAPLIDQLHAQFGQVLQTAPHEQLRLQAAAALGELPHTSAIPTLLSGLNDEVEPVRLAALDALIAWLPTAHQHRVPTEASKPFVFSAMMDHLNAPAFKNETGQSRLFSVLQAWQGSTPSTLLEPLTHYLEKHMGDAASDIDAGFISQGLLDCLREVLQNSSDDQRAPIEPWLLKLVVASLPRPELQDHALRLLPFVAVHTAQVQEVLQRIALQEGLPMHKRLIPLDVLFSHMDVLSSDTRTAIHQHLASLFQYTVGDDIDRLKDAWIQTSLRLLKRISGWPERDSARLFQTIDRFLVTPELETHLDVTWLLLRLLKSLNTQQPSTSEEVWSGKLNILANQGRQSAQIMQMLLK